MSRAPEVVAARSGLRRLMHDALRDLVGLVLPVECPGCGAWDIDLCAPCASLLTGPVRRCESGAPALAAPWAGAELPVWGVAPYTGAARAVVLAWKSGARLAGPVREAGRAAGLAWGRAMLAEGASFAGTVVVVPAPSGWRRRASGRLVVRDLAEQVAAGLAEAGLAPPGRTVVVDALRRRAGREHQTGLGAAGRSVNRRRSMRVGAPIPPGSVCVLVDDVLTTGATLAECRRVLTDAGHEVTAALVLAVAPGPSTGR